MRKLGACLTLGVLAAALCSPPPAAAFGLRIGPFHIGLPYVGWRYRHHPLYMRANPNDATGRDSAPLAPGQSEAAALLYPNLALSAIFQNIFWPTYASAWPFSYQAIFATAFAKRLPDQSAQLCQPSDDAKATIDRLRQEIAPTPDQEPLLQRLGGAIGAASGSLAKSCPTAIPSEPVARMQLMQSQLEELALAVDMIRQPLQDFAQSLTDEQKARFAAVPAAVADRAQEANAAPTCAGAQAAIGESADQIERSVQPTDAQRTAFDDMKQAFSQAAIDLQAHCPTSVPLTPFGRMEAIGARLDATYRAVLSIQVALANFETKLSDEQRSRFDTMDFASR
jgi:hypothetical protein